MKLRRPIIALCGLVASSALAQSPFTRTDGGDTILPLTSYPLGESQLVAQNMAQSLRMRWVQQDLCWTYGCLVIANDSRSFFVRSFLVQRVRPDGQWRWSTNQFDRSLRPKEGIMRIKYQTRDCDRAVKFILRHRETRRELTVQGRLNLCSTPHINSILRLRTVIPQVIVGEEGELN